MTLKSQWKSSNKNIACQIDQKVQLVGQKHKICRPNFFCSLVLVKVTHFIVFGLKKALFYSILHNFGLKVAYSANCWITWGFLVLDHVDLRAEIVCIFYKWWDLYLSHVTIILFNMIILQLLEGSQFWVFNVTDILESLLSNCKTV